MNNKNTESGEQLLRAARSSTVQYVPDARESASGGGALLEVGGLMDRTGLLPAWGTRFRETILRQFDRSPWLYLWQGAVAGLINRWVSTPWELFGEREQTDHFRQVFQNAQFGAGWSRFIRLIARDFLRHDIGAFIEIIAPGDPLAPVDAGIVGIAHLDALRCYPTRDPEYPVIYYARDGQRHLMHRTRVYRIVDMPDGDELYNGIGLCALARAVSILQREIYIGRYIQISLDDAPPPGIMTVQGMTERAFQNALASFRDSLQADSRDVFGRIMFLHSVDVNAQVGVQSISFSQPPEKFDWKTYTELQVNALALALGVDKLDLWEITSSGLGSGAQSEIMAQKAKGRTFGAFLTELERFFNLMLPDGMDFAFKPKDAEEDKENANAANAWASAVQIMGGALSIDEARTLLANQVEAVRDAIADAAGDVGRVSDTGAPRAIADDTDTSPLTGAVSSPVSVSDDAEDDLEAEPEEDGAILSPRLRALLQKTRHKIAGGLTVQPVYKGFATTSANFIGQLARIIRDLAVGARDKLYYANEIITALYQAGQRAYQDGLLMGGVNVDRLDEDDLRRVQQWLADQVIYVDRLVDSFWRTRGSDTNVSDVDFLNRAALWANKSLRAAFQRGMADADKNGMYVWRLGDTREHCRDCLRYHDQVHRLKTWIKYGALPGSSDLECRGFQCRCRLIRTMERARGRLTKPRWRRV